MMEPRQHFFVNGKLSKEWKVNPGIRQGCPLAPLLFVLTVDTLGQLINRNADLQGIAMLCSLERHHNFSVFVDDSTVFLKSAEELGTVKSILKSFGDLSGIRMQPQKVF